MNKEKLQELLLSFKGRIARKEFWTVVLIAFVSFLIVNGIVSRIPFLGVILSLILTIAFFWIEIAITVKRLHDLDKSGHLAWLALVPILGGVFLLVLCGFMKGTEGDNKFGPNSLA